MQKEEIIQGIRYRKPQVFLLQQTGIGVSEIAARTCYNSFTNSEHKSISQMEENLLDESLLQKINTIESSELLHELSWTYFHHSILEHTNLSYLIKGTSRGVLQEHARHRIQAISVKSTRYTMGNIINAFVSSLITDDKQFFIDMVLSFDMFVTTDENYNKLEIETLYEKLKYQSKAIEDFYSLAIAKSSLHILNDFNNPQKLYDALENGKKKRNVGDAFKHIVTDNWKVDMVITFNLRSLKNYFTLRDSGAAYFQIRWLAQEMQKVTPPKYLQLITKKEQ